MKILKVQARPVDVPALAAAALAQDTERVAAILDEALVFTGPAGSIVERIDGPVFEELSVLVVQAIREAVAQGQG